MLLCSFGELCSHHQQVPVYTTTTTANPNTNTTATATVAAGVFCVLM